MVPEVGTDEVVHEAPPSDVNMIEVGAPGSSRPGG
jgi:hypothetical protein